MNLSKHALLLLIFFFSFCLQTFLKVVSLFLNHQSPFYIYIDIILIKKCPPICYLSLIYLLPSFSPFITTSDDNLISVQLALHRRDTTWPQIHSQNRQSGCTAATWRSVVSRCTACTSPTYDVTIAANSNKECHRPPHNFVPSIVPLPLNHHNPGYYFGTDDTEMKIRWSQCSRIRLGRL